MNPNIFFFDDINLCDEFLLWLNCMGYCEVYDDNLLSPGSFMFLPNIQKILDVQTLLVIDRIDHENEVSNYMDNQEKQPLSILAMQGIFNSKFFN